MIATRGLGAGYGAAASFGMGAGFSASAPPAATGARGRRLVRWLIEMPTIENPVGQWIRQREDEEELFIL